MADEQRIQLGGEYITAPLVGPQLHRLGVSIDAGAGYNPTSDAFGRIRVSEPETLFDAALDYGARPLFWTSVTAGAGSATYDYNNASMSLAVGTASGDLAARQTKQHVPYQPGKSQRSLLTFVMAPGQTGLRQRVGMFDANDGLFLELDGTTLYVVQRSSTSGTPTDTRVAQASWNIDTMDGFGPGGQTLDIAKAQILWIDLEWLGVGNPRFGFVIDRAVYYVHEFQNANNVSTVYMRTARLPLRYEIENTSATAAAATLQQICAEISSEGGRQGRDLVFSAANGTALRSVTNVEMPVLAIQVGTAYPVGGTVPNRLSSHPLNVEIYSEDAGLYYRIVQNGTIAGGAWGTVDANYSGMLVNVGGTAITGGHVISTGYVQASTKSGAAASFSELETNLYLTLDVAGTAGDTLAVCCTRIGAVSTDTGVSITWSEF